MIVASYNKISLTWKSGNQIGRWSLIPQNVMFYTSRESVIRMFMSISLKDKPWTLCILSNTLVSTYPTTSAGTNISNKANKTLGFRKRNLIHCPPRTKETAYKALVRQLNLEYCSSVWDPYTAKNIFFYLFLQKLTNLQE